MTFAPPPQSADPHDTPVPFPLLRSAAVLLVSVLVPGGLITVALELLGQPVYAQANILAAGICFVGCVVGLLPVWMLSKQHRHGAAQGFMAGMLLRILACGVAYFALQWAGYTHTQPLLYFLAGWYLLTLMVEVKLISSFLLAHAVAPGSTPAPAPAPGCNPGSDPGSGRADASASRVLPPDSNATALSGRVGLEGDV